LTGIDLVSVPQILLDLVSREEPVGAETEKFVSVVVDEALSVLDSVIDRVGMRAGFYSAPVRIKVHELHDLAKESMVHCINPKIPCPGRI
jgi:hypothetical protein